MKFLIIESFNPAEAGEGFSRYRNSIKFVHEVCFNPAEAGEGFSRIKSIGYLNGSHPVSIQPKPEKGLVVNVAEGNESAVQGFNPAEAGEGFSSLYGGSLQHTSYRSFNPAEAGEGFSSNLYKVKH